MFCGEMDFFVLDKIPGVDFCLYNRLFRVFWCAKRYKNIRTRLAKWIEIWVSSFCRDLRISPFWKTASGTPYIF